MLHVTSMRESPFRFLGVSLLGLGMLGTSAIMGQEEFPDFDLRVECARRVAGRAGSPIQFPGQVILKTDPRQTDGSTGARAWSLSLRASGGARILSATTKKTAGAELPDGLRQDGYELTEITAGVNGQGESNEGVVSAVVLSLSEDVYLPGSGDAVLLNLVMEATAPGSGCKSVEVFFSDGLIGSGQPVRNVITWQAFSRRDDGGADDADTDGYENCIASLCAENRFMRGDTSGDKIVNISDAVFFLDHLFRGGPTPRCLEASDINDDGLLNVSDGVYLLSFLFRGGSPPVTPYPDCGLARTDNKLSCEDAPGCN